MTDPTTQSYSRQQVGALTGIADDTIAYWLKQGLLVPTTGGKGRGDHRKFDFLQVNIAAIYDQLRRFGVNTSTLRVIGSMLQEAAKLRKLGPLHPANYWTAACVATQLSLFRSGKIVLIRAHEFNEDRPKHLSGRAFGEWLTAKRAAVSEGEIVSQYLRSGDYDPIDQIVAVAEQLGPGKETIANLYADLVYDALAPGYSGPYSWLVSVQLDGTCKVEFGADGAKFFERIGGESPEEFGPAIFLPTSGILRKIWGFKSSSIYARERKQAYISKKLAAAGITATVSVYADEEESFTINAPGVERKLVEAALRGSLYEIEQDEGSQGQ